MVRAVSHPAPDYALVLRDDDGRSYCSWRLTPSQAIALQPGQWLGVRWEECFNIGADRARYGYLPLSPARELSLPNAHGSRQRRAARQGQ